MNEKDIVSAYAKELKLASVRENAALFAGDAMREQWGHLSFLRRLLEEEVTQRREKSKITRIHRADFPQMKYLEELQREELPLEGQMLLPEVETLEFIKEGRSIVMYGNPGTGKTHIAIALGIKACLEGYSVFFTSVPRLLTHIREAKTEKTLRNLEIKFERYDLVICDELGYVGFDKESVWSSVSGQVGSFGCLSGNKDAITGTSGVLLKVPVKADAALAIGTPLEATLSELTFTTTGVVEVPFDDVTFNITIKAKEYTILDKTSTTAPAASKGEVDVKVLRTIKANEWSTLVLPFDMTEEQLKAALGDDVQLAEFVDYEADYDDDNVTGLAVNFAATDLTEGFYGNYPYLVKTSKEITEFIVKTTVLPDEEEAVAEYDNGKSGKQRKVYGSLIGTYHAGDAIPADGLFLNGNKFWYSAGKTKIKAFRAYFMINEVLSCAGGEAKIRFTVDEKPTKIEGVGESNVIQGAVYNVNGQLVGHDIDLNSQPKGIYFVDGKKVVNY